MFRKGKKTSTGSEDLPTTEPAENPIAVPAKPTRKKHVNSINHTEELLKRIAALQNDTNTADVWFVVGPQQIKICAHRSVLGTASEYFRDLLYSKADKGATSTWNLKQADPDAFKLVIEYLYTGQIRKLGDLTNKMNVMVMADVFDLADLAKSVAEIITEEITPENACKLYMHSVTHEDERLRGTLEQFIERNAEAVLASDGVTRLSTEAMLKFVQSDGLKADELSVFRGVTRWLKAAPEQRLEDAKNIGVHIRLPLIDTDALLGEVETAGFISSDRLIRVVKIHHEKSPTPREGKEFTPRGTNRANI